MTHHLTLLDQTVDDFAFLTGATGLVGQYLMRDLLLRGVRLAVLARPQKNVSALQRVEEVLNFWEAELGIAIPRPVVFEGDVSADRLGLSDDDYQWLSDHCDKVIHNAAVLRFHSSGQHDEPWRTNLGGTKNVLSLASECDIQHLHYVSTAYVCGNRTEAVLEADFTDQHGFRNEYEQSKFQSELLVRNVEGFDNKTIYRPVVISGDSKTGFTSTYHGLFVYLRLFSMFIPEQARGPDGKILTPVKIPMEGNEPRNVVPVDWVSDVFCELFLNPQAHGRTYHLAPDQCLTPAEVIDACYDYFNSHGAEFCGTQIPDDHDQPEYAEKIADNLAIYQQYESNDPSFDTTNLKQFAGHISCPPIDTATIHRYLDFGNSRNWGKQQPLKVFDGNERIERTA